MKANALTPDTKPRRSPVPLQSCALARAIAEIGDGWTLLILREAFCGVDRFDAMQADLGIPRSVLTQRLTRMVALGLLEKQVYRVPGQRPRPCYRLTDKGLGLIPALIALRQWADDHWEGEPSPLVMVDRDATPVKVRLLREDQQNVEDLRAIRAINGQSFRQLSIEAKREAGAV